MNHIRPIQIGDYADISFDNLIYNGIYEPATYRYYIIKIESDGITIAQISGINQKLLLTKNDQNIWQIEGYTDPHSIKFTKNATDIQYIDRDFTKSPIKTIDIAYDFRDHIQDFIELKNGIILFYDDTANIFGFSEPNSGEAFPPKIISFSFLEIHYSHNDSSPHLQIMNLGDLRNPDNQGSYNQGSYNEIYIWNPTQHIINKFNINAGTFEIYEKNPHYTYVYPLKDMKILCVLDDGKLRIIDLITNIRINITNVLPYIGPIRYYQLSNMDIIIPNYTAHTGTEFYRVDIRRSTLEKIFSSNIRLTVVNILLDDNFLLWDSNAKLFKIWDFSDNQVIQTFYRNISARFSDEMEYPTSIILSNGEIFFTIYENFYLFDYTNKELIDLPLLKRNPMRNVKQLKDGNLIFNNKDVVTILEFPIDQTRIDRRNYDMIKGNIKSSTLDLINFIREYL